MLMIAADVRADKHAIHLMLHTFALVFLFLESSEKSETTLNTV